MEPIFARTRNCVPVPVGSAITAKLSADPAIGAMVKVPPATLQLWEQAIAPAGGLDIEQQIGHLGRGVENLQARRREGNRAAKNVPHLAGIKGKGLPGGKAVTGVTVKLGLLPEVSATFTEPSVVLTFKAEMLASEMGVVETSAMGDKGETTAVVDITCAPLARKDGAGTFPDGQNSMVAERVSPTSVPGEAKFLDTCACKPSPPGKR